MTCYPENQKPMHTRRIYDPKIREHLTVKYRYKDRIEVHFKPLKRLHQHIVLMDIRKAFILMDAEVYLLNDCTPDGEFPEALIMHQVPADKKNRKEAFRRLLKIARINIAADRVVQALNDLKQIQDPPGGRA